MSRNSNPSESESSSSLSIVLDSSSDYSLSSEHSNPEPHPVQHKSASHNNKNNNIQTQNNNNSTKNEHNSTQNERVSAQNSPKTGPKSEDVEGTAQNAPELNVSSIQSLEQTIESSCTSSIDILGCSSEENSQEDTCKQINELIKAKNNEQIVIKMKQITEKDVLEQNQKNVGQYVENIYKEAQNQLKLIDEGKENGTQKLQQALKDLQECDKHFGKQPFYKNQYDSIANQVKLMLQKEENALNTLKMSNVDQFYKNLTVFNQFINFDKNLLNQYNLIVKKIANSLLMIINNISAQIYVSPIQQVVCNLDIFVQSLNQLLNIPIVHQQVLDVKQYLLNYLEEFVNTSEHHLLKKYFDTEIVELEQNVRKSRQIFKIFTQIAALKTNEQSVQNIQFKIANIIQQWNHNEDLLLKQIQHNITKNPSFEILNIILLKSNILCLLDCYRTNSKQSIIQTVCTQQINQLTDQNLEQICQHIYDQQFEKAQQCIYRLNSNHEIIKIVSNKVKQIIEQNIESNTNKTFQNTQLFNSQDFSNQLLIDVLQFVKYMYDVTQIKDASDQIILDMQVYDNLIIQLISMIQNILNIDLKFEQIKNDLKQSQFDKVEQSIEIQKIILEVIVNSKLSDKNKQINKLNQQLDSQIQLIIEQLQKSKQMANKDNVIDLSSNNLKQLICSFTDTTSKKEYNTLNQHKKQIQENIKESYTQFSEQISNKKFDDLFAILPKVWDDWTFYQNELKKLQQQNLCQDQQYKLLYTDGAINNYCTRIVDDINKSMSNFASSLNKNTVMNPNTQQEYLSNIILFMSQVQSNSSLGTSLKNSSKYSATIYQQSQAKIIQVMKNNSNLFDQNLSSINNLNEILETAKNQQPIYKQLSEQQDLSNIKSYEEMIKLLEKEIQINEGECKSKQFICPKTLTENREDRVEYYQAVFQSFKNIQKAKPLQIHLQGCEISTIEEGCIEKFNIETQKIYQSLIEQMNKLPCDDRRQYQTFNNYCDNLSVIETKFQRISTAQIAQQKLNELKTIVENKPTELMQFVNNQDTLVTRLILYKQMSIDTHIFRRDINIGIDNVLNKIYQSNNGPEKLSELGYKLNTHINQQVAQQIINEHQKLKDYQTFIRNSGSLRFTLDDVLDDNVDEKIRIDLGIERAKGLSIQVQDRYGNLVDQPVNRAEIKQMYQEFDTKYWAQVEPYLYKVQEGFDVLKQLVQLASQQKVFSKQNKIEILSNVLAYWTLSKTKDYIGTNDKDESRKKLLQPHPAQIVAIFSLLGIDQSNQLKNQLIQVLTGEGKSVILAVTAIVLAIMGFDVNCACYSEYLSQRDYESFTDLFNAFNVREQITYGTFGAMCEKYINQEGDIRSLTKSCITWNTIGKSHSQKKREQILMIDEVDVFFNEDFYGSSYNPITTIQNDEIAEFFDYIWANRNDSQLLEIGKISKTEPYKKFINSLKGWEELVKEAAVDILSDIIHFKTHKYIVHNGLIGYKSQDTISTSTYYGYRTLFAYYQEVENKQINEQQLRTRKNIHFSCGNFSYAEIPKNYKHIIGVTGTLDTVSKPEMKLLTDEYNIKKFSYLPSVYGTNQLTFSKDSCDFVKIVEQKEYYLSIVSEIIRRKQNNIGIPVLVFFETSEQLEQFQKSQEVKAIDNSNQIKTLTELVLSSQKEGIVRQAVTKGTVTLISREFGRGTDFVCYDQTIDGYGGVHVIQTFFSDELSEEKQIKGRTARQGKFGSYSMIIVDSELEKYGLKLQDIDDMKAASQYYSGIDQKRRDYFDGKYPERTRNIQSIKASHDRSNRFLEAIISGNINAAKDYLLNKNQSYGAAKTKTLILMDITGSMGGAIELLKNTIDTIFGNVHSVLKQCDLKDSFEVMFAGYRSYNSSSADLLVTSDYESNPNNLQKFLSKVKVGASSPWGNEAVEVGLQFANAEYQNGLSQVILIGDIGPNTEEQVIRGREESGEEYWSQTTFAVKTSYLPEVNWLRQKSVKVHCLFIGNEARESFEEISRETNGTNEELELNAEQMTHKVAEKIVKLIGDKTGKDLLKIYREKFE
ncbi:Helicase-related_protein [Hexamita inflata]|uniref:Helicase-related protein n=1 Tax=Hexamita inflata TaxID=28002 RepID=A0AA86PW84_9EUKA|nr:Helicase-related protein [Hexamita inflata]